MNHQMLENELRAKIKKIRIIEAAVCILSAVLAIIFLIMYYQSREVAVIDYAIWEYQSVSYNYAWMWATAACFFVSAMASGAFIVDLLFTKLYTVEVNGYYITIYRGYRTNLYIDGELKDSLFLLGYYLEATLPDRTKVTVSLGKWSAHMSFSDGRTPIDL